MKVKDYYSDKSKWTRGVTFRDSEGSACGMNEATCACLSGAIDICYRNIEYDLIWEKICRHLNIICLTSWNDDPQRTFKEVKQLVEELDI